MVGIKPMSLVSIQSDINYFIPKSIIATNVQILWDKGYYGKDIHIAILDTGCDVNHICLRDRIAETKNFIDGTSDVTDENGHGTHVSAIIGANRVETGMTGIAPESSLHIYKVLSDNGNGSMDNIIKAINHAINQKVDIINLSLGGSENNRELNNAIINAIDNNICVCAASGNEAYGDNGNVDEISYPGAFRECIQIGSIKLNETMSKFSNSNDNLDLCAYGDEITSCYPGNRYATCSGTSQATPQISGALALLKQKFITEYGRRPDESEIYAQLIKNTKTIPELSRKLQGSGILYFREN